MELVTTYYAIGDASAMGVTLVYPLEMNEYNFTYQAVVPVVAVIRKSVSQIK